MKTSKKEIYDLVDLTFEQIELINIGLESLDTTDVVEIKITEKLIDDIDELING